MSKAETKERLEAKVKNLFYRYNKRKSVKKKGVYEKRIKALLKRIGEFAE